MANPNPTILITIDVEDWFQVENFKPYIPYSTWTDRELRVEKNTHRLLDLFDSVSCQAFPLDGKSSESCKSCLIKPKVTFFVLGWIAERLPDLVREIHQRGHEVASHGYCHTLCSKQNAHELKTDLCHSKSLLEDITGAPVYGYRAPSFAIDNDILKTIADCGYLYDSSYNSFSLHGRYGKADIRPSRNGGIAMKLSSSFYELPISNFKFANHILPWGGGAYFRLIPTPLFDHGVRSILKKDKAYVFYFHPWEVDPDQPRVKQASRFARFRHYTHLNKTAEKLKAFVERFKNAHFVSCHQYIRSQLEPCIPQP